MPILSRKSEEFFCEEPNHYEEEEEGLENEELELPITEISYVEPEPELPINDIFENEIPYDEDYITFENSILKKPFEFMTFYEFMNYLPQFHKYLSRHSWDYNHTRGYQRLAADIRFLYMNANSFSHFYQCMEETFT